MWLTCINIDTMGWYKYEFAIQHTICVLHTAITHNRHTIVNYVLRHDVMNKGIHTTVASEATWVHCSDTTHNNG